jgi:phosphatidylserine/phosphatidylglycerophosphate/cardiolipin synthase-like enzyme
MLQALVPHLFRYVRAPLGRVHRRRPHRALTGRQPGGRMPADQWWSSDDRWYEGDAAPRPHNALRPLVDGQETFAAMLRALAAAREYVFIAGWALTPAFALARGSQVRAAEGLLADVLAEVSRRVPVKLLVWRGSQCLFQPVQALTKQVRAELVRAAPQLDCQLDGTAGPTHCHHQKAVVVDGQIGFVGGLDLTTLAGDRWDVPGHPLRHGRSWHDVALAIRGEAVADLERNFAQRWAAVTGERDLPHREPQLDPAWQTPCQIIRTIPRRIYPFARHGVYGIAAAYQDAIARAQRFIYLENQYLWSPEIVDALADALVRDHDGPFRLVVVLPARADCGKYDNDQQIDRLRAADAGQGRFHAFSLYSGGPTAGRFGVGFVPIYVHAKVAIIDDEWYTIGSANLNRRGLATDSELNAQAIDPAGARALRVRLWAEHLGVAGEEIAATDPLALIDTVWVARARQVAAIVKQQRGTLPALIYPYQSGTMPGRWLFQELESLAEGL